VFETDEVGEEVAEQQDAAPESWDGAIDTLLTQPWVPEDARPHLEKHLAAHQDVSRRRDFFEQVFAADDRTAELTKRLETTNSELASLKEAFGQATEKVSSYETREAEVDGDRQLADWRGKYPDIFTEKDESDDTTWHRAWEHFYKLIDAGYPEERAAQMARVYLPDTSVASTPAAPAPPRERVVEVPAAVRAASRGSASPSVTVNSAEANENLESRILRMEREERARQGMR
jgi:hypothetical protein